MNLSKLQFVKNIDDPNNWAYSDWAQGSQQQLHWSSATGSFTNADKANIGDMILLVQKPPGIDSTIATHLVEVSSINAEEINDNEWGIVRQVKVIWVANHQFPSCVPKDKDIFGWKRHRAQGPRIIQLTNIKDERISEIWHSLEIFQRHVSCMLGLTEE